MYHNYVKYWLLESLLKISMSELLLWYSPCRFIFMLRNIGVVETVELFCCGLGIVCSPLNPLFYVIW